MLDNVIGQHVHQSSRIAALLRIVKAANEISVWVRKLPLHEHRHHHVHVARVADGPDHARARRARRFERHFADIIERLEHVLEVLAVEGDLRCLPLHLHVDVAAVVADLFRASGDDQLPGALALAGSS